MNADFIPSTDAALYLWCTNYEIQIAAVATKYSIPKTSVTDDLLSTKAIKDAIDLANHKAQEATSAVAAKTATNQNALAALRSHIAGYKTANNMALEDQKILGIAPIAVQMDPDTYKATITAEKFAGFVRLKFVKKGVDGINIYHRKKGDPQWHFLARDTKSPYDDHIELTTPALPEHWEYKAFGVLNDAEIGQPSDIVEIVYGQ